MDDLERCIEEGRRASEALLAGAEDWRGIMLWLADQVAEECLIRLQQQDDEDDDERDGLTFHSVDEYEEWEHEWHPEWYEPEP